MVEISVTSGKIFRESLSKVGLDLIAHFKLLQEDPSEILGSFNLRSSMASLDDDCNNEGLVQESQHQNMERLVPLSKLHGVNDEHDRSGFSRTEQDSLSLQEMGTVNCLNKSQLSPVCQMNSYRGEKCWDNFSWSTQIVANYPNNESGGQPAEHRDFSMTQQDSLFCEETGSIMSFDKGGLSPMCQYNVPCIGEKCSDKFPWSTCLSATGTEGECNQSAQQKRNHDDYMEHSYNSAADKNSRPLSETRVEMHDSFRKFEGTVNFQKNCLSSDNLQSSVVNDETVPMDTVQQDDAFSKVEEEGKVPLEESNLCVSSHIALDQQTFLLGQQSLANCNQNQAFQEQKKRFHLDELITGAVIAECQFHQKTLSHFNLQLLSQLLCAQMTSIYEKQKTILVVLKDLVLACNSAQDITLQRYFAALLSAAHQQNLGSWKHSAMEGCQILLQEGWSGKLCDVTISLLSLGDLH